MASAPPPVRRRGPVLRWSAAAVAAVTVVTGAVLAQGYDEQEMPRLETGVWVTRDDGRYARVNTDLGELELVRAVAEPAGVTQAGSRSVVYTQGYAQAWPIDPSAPLDLVDGGEDGPSPAAQLASPTPSGTQQVATAGDYLLYRTALGEVYLGTYPEQGAPMGSTQLLDPLAGQQDEQADDSERYAAAAVAVDDSGTVVAYSAAEEAIREFDASDGTWTGEPVPVSPAPATEAELSLSFADDLWVMLDATTGQLWVEGADAPVALELEPDAVLQATASAADGVLVADGAGLTRVDTVTGTAERIANASGTPAPPVTIDGRGYAAWVSTAGASLWDAATGAVTSLEVEPGTFDDVQATAPAFRSNGDRAVLSESGTGTIWTLPDGELVPAAAWDAVEDTDEVLGERAVEDVVEQEPPVAVDDALGVRAGSVVSLPVLYNDHDPNSKDVLTIDSASISGLDDPDFGELGLVSQDQQAVIRVRAASGSTSFTYAVTDGTATSEAATVTLSVVPESENSAPVWCGVDACTQEWPRPQIAPGGYSEIPILRGWVDPEGDAIVLTDARADDLDAPVTVVPSDDGSVAIRHLDPNAGDAVIPITVTVADAYGLESTRVLELQVTGAPALEAQPIALAGALGEPRSVEIADHVSGGSGSYRLVDALLTQASDDVTVTPIAASGAIELTAQAPGRFSATYTVEDTVTNAQATATLRYTVAEESRPITIPPLTAFVRAQEDTTVDVLAAAQETSGRVLMIAEATSADPNLSVSVVGTSYVRVSGTTEDGEPGRVGTADVLVADGAGNTASTQLTVFLLPPADGLGPIAMPDTVSVRAGSQIDIDVLDNDASPRGERLMLSPEIEGSGLADELAFASGKTLRYLAPATPGVYTLRYTTFIESDVSRTDSSRVTVTVLPEGANLPPEPRTLTARVLVGQSVRIPVDPAGIDPDGDAVTLVDVSQPPPAMGTASVSGSGAAINYRAPILPVEGGQVTFTYTVVDEQGEAATASVRVGVLGSELSDVAPVTYSDYVSAQVGSTFPVPVEPLLNDSDPLQGELRVIDVRPNATPESSEYARLEALLDRAAFEADGTIAVLPGDVAGTHSYIYTVESPVSLSTAEGRIVVDVSEQANPSTLRIQDTVLTARTRHDLEAGVDVVSGKVQWQGGDVSGLRLALWDEVPSGLTVSGWTVSGSLPRERTIVPFSLTGTDYASEQVTSYGFLRIPALDDMRLQLAADIAPITVEEEASVDIDVRELLDIGPTDAVELRDDPVYAVQRPSARCTPGGGSTVTYAAGREAPWADTCSVVVRLASQDTWSVVAVPLSIVPLDPQPILGPVSRTIRPAEDDTVDLIGELVTWEGGRVGDVADLALTTTYSGSAFEVTTAGGVLTATARADAVPGTREVVRVSTPTFGGLETTVTLVVGAAAEDAPRGATFRQTCDVSASSRCTITVAGVAGEYDPFAGAAGGGLTLDTVGSSGTVSCSVATVTKASDTQVTATWPSGPRPEGGECVVNYTVVDAQGRSGAGTLTIDVQGYPKPPASVTTSGYTGTSVTLDVALGPAAQAHPPVTSVAILRGGGAVDAACSSAGASLYRCTVSGLENGEQATYTARAVNAVGESLDSTPHTTWAYESPEISSVTAAPVYRPTTTSATQGAVEVTVQSSSDTRSFTVSGTDRTIQRSGASTTFEIALPVGPQVIQVVPVSGFRPPTSTDNLGQAKNASVTVAGSPSFAQGIDADANGTSITVSGGGLQTNSSQLARSEVWFAWTGSTPSCSMDGSGRARVDGAYRTSSTSTISGLEERVRYRVAVCGSNGYGAVMSGQDDAYTWVEYNAPNGNATYRVATTWEQSGRTYHAPLRDEPSLARNNDDGTLYYWYDGRNRSTEFRVREDVIEDITAAYCSTFIIEYCGGERAITPASGSPAAPVTVTFPAAPGVTHPDGSSQDACWPQGAPPGSGTVSISGAASGSASITVADGSFTVTFSGAFATLETITHPFTTCDPPPDPDPTPSPEPSP
ncbi:Ig-like domain-containing protein [Demequina sp. NBRC 110053]|uniref:Ig-like domain-containing protein n=1 Tax=Demequina sp. NBRC 110053 TaxID=1570342 RepID=UPI000A03E747|nr:Ig-like domain-containing protein [Demequina sp. NBRC 110053]